MTQPDPPARLGEPARREPPERQELERPPRVGGMGMTARDQFTTFEAAVAVVLDSLQIGDVVTYGEVAAEAGYPGRARAVGAFLAAHGGDYPWWRVVTASGRLVPGHEQDHARRLRREGVEVGTRVRRAR